MQFRRQSNQDEQINLTPLIDVTFLLLIFFMLSTTFIKETHLSINLPEVKTESVTLNNDEPIELIVKSNGNYFINGELLKNQRATTLQHALKLIANDTHKPLTVTADANTPHQAVVRAINVAGKLGFSQVNITTREAMEQ